MCIRDRLEFVRKDGSVLPVSLNATAIRDAAGHFVMSRSTPVSYTHLRAHETVLDLVCRLLLEKKTKLDMNIHLYTTNLKSSIKRLHTSLDYTPDLSNTKLYVYQE